MIETGALTIDRDGLKALFPPLPERTNKGDRGRVLMICGSYDPCGLSMCGAAYFAAKAAYRCGAGIVEIFAPKENYPSLASLVPEAVFSLYGSDEPADLVTKRLASEIDFVVKGIDEEGNETQVADGEYTTEDKKVIVVADGKVTEINEVEEAPIEEPTEEPIEAEDEPVEDEKDARIKALEDEIASKDKEIEELKAKIKELEDEPAAKSADEEFAKAEAKEDNTPRGKMSKRGYKF
jgi:NAD(P)H-hydrate repair Nnr-like enzyme with NAD(P)H-hydrate dehydratase domain